MARHAILVETGVLTETSVGGVLTPGRDESEHAVKVKRTSVGDHLTLIDGAGGIGIGEVIALRPELALRVKEFRHVDPIVPRVEVWSATPKGPRLEDMIEQLSQVGVALWRPIECDFGVVEPGEHKMERCRRVARESAKQCGRAWVMQIDESAGMQEALSAPSGTLLVIADAKGQPWAARGPTQEGHHTASTIRLLVGPEGGFSPNELDRAAAAGAVPVCFGPHVMRIETAAVCGAARIVGG